jgi:hypothetical protein
MRSRPDAGRRRLESACRLGVFALIGWMLGTAFFPTPALRTRDASAADLARALPAWTTAPRTDVLTLALDRAPSRAQLAWLSALRRAGHVVTWSGSVQPTALSVEPAPGPHGAWRFSVAAPDSASLRLVDSLGDIQSLNTRGRGARLVVPAVDGRAAVAVGHQELGAGLRDTATLRAVLVVGRAGWEAKYTAAALEEGGWQVETRFAVAPGVIVGNAAGAVIDTAHLSAIVALDTSVNALGPALNRFVRSGGGLVLAGGAAAAAHAAALAPGQSGPRVPASASGSDTLGLASAGYLPVARLRPDAQALERRGGDVVVAARRVGAGRVLQLAYDETWRWRMSGGPGSEAGHREWWSRLVSTVAYARFAPARGIAAPEFTPMPLAAVVNAVGASRPAPVLPHAWSVDQRWLLAAIFLLLLVEWTSRRLRGSR